ncbi:hypothetical protein GCM10010464_86370 [Pseudonocardia yunnanensis]
MGMIGYGIAATIGYYVGRPEGRRQLTTLRRQAAELVRSPEARRLREHGWDLVGDGALATRSLAWKMRPRSTARDGDGNVDATRRGLVLRGRSWRRSRPDSDATAAATADPVVGITPAGTGGPAGFSTTTPTEDAQSANPGMSVPPLAGGTRPPVSPEN